LVLYNDSNQWSALHVAAFYGREEVVVQHIDAKAYTLCVDSEGRTPCALAALMGRVGCVKQLILKNMDKPGTNWTGLHLAAIKVKANPSFLTD
jgi:ankyrin repeat protein